LIIKGQAFILSSVRAMNIRDLPFEAVGQFTPEEKQVTKPVHT
jgi:hypothetical protein